MDWMNYVVIPVIKSVVLVLVVLGGAAYMTWGERKLCGRFQVRYGPNRAGKFGLLQPIADAGKMFFKEEFIPATVDKVVYVLAPMMSVFAVLILLAVVPFGPDIHLLGRTVHLYIADVNIGILYVLAMGGIGIYGVVFGGWASNNNYSLLGALRTTAQIVSYELPMGLAVVSLLLVAGSFSVVDIVNKQSSIWYIVFQPLGFVIYFIATLAETKRSPFDLPETENELVSGFATEYGGIKFALFFLAEYAHIVVASALAAALFLGGWHGPFAAQYPLLGVVYFIVKIVFMLFLFVWVRASLPRIRYDELMSFSWKFLVPLALLNLAVTAVAVVALA